ncbi:hypothetical protein [Allorhizocola rhizosphaerae]|nr:hypothetical protein [Allorhizocola rhizosphaerae]
MSVTTAQLDDRIAAAHLRYRITRRVVELVTAFNRNVLRHRSRQDHALI